MKTADEREAPKTTVESELGTQVIGSAPSGAFVRLEPLFAHDFPPPAGEAFMDQSAQAFVPSAMVARTGQAVQFHSREDILHNVRVIRADDKVPIFNVVTPPWGAYTHVFDDEGTYEVTCDIHSAMRATILVSSTPYATAAGEDGSFAFADVVPGRYKLIAFSGPHALERVVTVSGTRTRLKVP